MSNREDWNNIVDELIQMSGIDGNAYGGPNMSLRERLERELNNAFVAGQEHEERKQRGIDRTNPVQNGQK